MAPPYKGPQRPHQKPVPEAPSAAVLEEEQQQPEEPEQEPALFQALPEEPASAPAEEEATEEPLDTEVPFSVEASAPAEPEKPVPGRIKVPEHLEEFITLAGPASYGPVVVNGARIRAYAGKPIRVANLEERCALLGLPAFRLATARDFAPPYSGPITLDVIRGGGLRDPEQI